MLKLNWMVIAATSVVVGGVAFFLTRRSSAATVTKAPVKTTNLPGGPTGETKPAPDASVSSAEVALATANKEFVDENGVRWDFYGYSDGSWEATIMDPKVATAYVRTFHEPTASDVLFMIKSHAETYEADGKTIKKIG